MATVRRDGERRDGEHVEAANVERSSAAADPDGSAIAYEHHSKLDWLELFSELFSELLATSLLLLLLLYKNSSPVLLLLLWFRLLVRFLIEQCVSMMIVMPQSLCTLF